MADTGGIQLIPGTKRKIDISRPGENRLMYMGGLVFIIFLVIGFVAFQYRSSVESRIESTDLKIGEIEAESRRLSREKETISLLANQFDIASELIRNHVIWTKGLLRVEDRIRPDVQVSALNANVRDGRIGLSGFTLSYTHVARQIASFLKEESVTDVSVSKMSSGPSGLIEFDMLIDFNADNFIKDIPVSLTTDDNLNN